MFRLILTLAKIIWWISARIYPLGDRLLYKGAYTSGLKGRVYRKVGLFIIVDLCHWISEFGHWVATHAPRDRRPVWLRF